MTVIDKRDGFGGPVATRCSFETGSTDTCWAGSKAGGGEEAGRLPANEATEAGGEEEAGCPRMTLRARMGEEFYQRSEGQSPKSHIPIPNSQIPIPKSLFASIGVIRGRFFPVLKSCSLEAKAPPTPSSPPAAPLSPPHPPARRPSDLR